VQQPGVDLRPDFFFLVCEEWRVFYHRRPGNPGHAPTRHQRGTAHHSAPARVTDTETFPEPVRDPLNPLICASWERAEVRQGRAC
jgi:hypothetical protein